MAGLSCEQSFFHGSLGRSRAEALMTSSPDDGTFIIRTSTSTPGNYVLSLVAQRNVLHFQIRNQGECWFSIDDGPLFEGLDDLIEHYSHLPDGLPCVLGKHLPVRPPRHGLKEKNTKLHDAAASGNAGAVSKYSGGKDTNAKNALGRTPLHESCRCDHIECTRRLLSGRGTPDVNAADSFGWTPLHFAAANGNAKMIRELIQRGGDVRAITIDAETPRQVAARLGNSEACRILSDIEDGHSMERAAALLELVWYHGKLTRTAAENIISIYGLEDGLFLVRFSPSSGNFILTTCFDQAMFHFQIQFNSRDSLYFIDDGPGCHSLADLVHYYSTKADGLPCVLRKYCKRSQKGPGLTQDSMSVYATGSLDSAASSAQEPVHYEAPRTHARASGQQQQARVGAHDAKDYNHMHDLDRALSQQAQVSRDAINIIQYSALHLGSELGAGEFGAVYGGTWMCKDGRQVKVAVKTIKPERMGSKDDFLREAQLMSTLKHPNIVQLLGIVEQPNLMIVQELVPNGSLESYFQKHKRDSVSDFQRVLWGSQIANGMAYLEKVKCPQRGLTRSPGCG
ncbi:hypothetical protein PTSG_10626 [Salpingoeca rosetta]|uniref:Non-specific protein-tyrosine kinase n=1 Tax=Salpingoeca rosetta (strain ATCC 50818 / BSB-021) TaxID=946362 RepID=F2URW6_SALR5|nr:uncharacterized protein PTSG_10626 [Salpingoeca rosetta]EGD80371.1 hypothetical protein PTSG_10626 [Salpingoeca rosetta]|eukprot:XP_004988161.1 hypothetical protein PTSG_10626 [Salpingoeca rosetta]